HPDRFKISSSLGLSLFLRFERHRRIEDLEEAVELHRAGLELCPDDQFHLSMCLEVLANALVARFQWRGQTTDLDEAIELYRASLKLRSGGHPFNSKTLNNLAVSLQIRFEQHGRATDIDEAIGHHRTVLLFCPDSHPERPASLNNLANALRTRFEYNGRIADLDESIEYRYAVLRLCPDDHPDRPMYLTNFAISLRTRFIQHGRTADLDDAIDHVRTALRLYPDSHPNRSTPLSCLASFLRTRFEQYGQSKDLDEVIEHHRTALKLCPVGHHDHSLSLNNLAAALQIRFQQRELTADLDEAIDHVRLALLLCPDDHPERGIFLTNLADALLARFKQHGRNTDLNEAISHRRTALQLCPVNHSLSLYNLATALMTQFEQHGRPGGFDESSELHCAVPQLRPDSHLDHSTSPSNLGSSSLSCVDRFGLTDSFEECMQLFERAAEHEFSSLVIRLRIARQWANFARSHAHHTTPRAYKAAMSLLQQILIISPTLLAQHDVLTGKNKCGTLALDAVAFAIEINRLEEAVETLEQGRCLLWSQMRGFRTPLDRLSEINGKLADRFRNVSQQLESLTTSSNGLQSGPSTAGSRSFILDVHRERELFEEKLKLKKQLSSEQKDAISEIRRVPGFENFLTATPFKILQQAASEGPVIVVNHSRYRSDALIVLPRKDVAVVCVPLDGEFGNDSIKLCIELLETRAHSKASSLEYDKILRRVKKMLWDRVVSKVVKKLEELGIPRGSRIWWCPTFGLSAFPFYAAGPFEDANGTVKYLLDDYVSSYTPTLGALINARSRENINIGKPTMLIVGDTVTLGSTEAEVRAVQKNTSNYVSSHRVLLNEKANREKVLKHLQKATWIHFACHGHLGRGSLDSSFRLSDGGLTLLDIIRANLPNAEFAFLSACHTAEQDICSLYDEILHLAAAIQFSRFRSMIGTMWELFDPDGPLLAKEVYSYMGGYEDGEVIHKRSAAALRRAVLKLREEGGVMTEQWVNLVHIGA
ncbi:TPR-like protein, partial [Fomitiporia mediterranea MF3/22]|uniref:TPR-like protein n=1 Tax=Fomitiporia mediterranea (strain MF3/22) TaxID=694068 RepID=UPI0004407FC8